MASTANDGPRIPDRETRNAITQLAAEITALSGQVTALSGHVATAVSTLVIATDTLTAVITNLYDVKQALRNAGLMLT